LKIRNENKKKVVAKTLSCFLKKKTLFDLPNKKTSKAKNNYNEKKIQKTMYTILRFGKIS
jgi:hypothetical protein